MPKKLLMNNYSENEMDYDFYLKNKTFDGISDYVDTGLNLFESDTDWCIYINFTNLVESGAYLNIIHHVDEKSANYPGVALAKNDKNSLDIGGNSLGWWSVLNLANTLNHKIVVFRRGSEVGLKFPNSNIVNRHNYKFTIFSHHLHIGCRYYNGIKDRYWKGIINELIIYKNKTVTDEEIDSLLQRGE